MVSAGFGNDGWLFFPVISMPNDAFLGRFGDLFWAVVSLHLMLTIFLQLTQVNSPHTTKECVNFSFLFQKIFS